MQARGGANENQNDRGSGAIAGTYAVYAIEAARSRFNASMRDLESAFDIKASVLRQAFINEVSEHLAVEAA
jgi:hypothetical protein